MRSRLINLPVSWGSDLEIPAPWTVLNGVSRYTATDWRLTTTQPAREARILAKAHSTRPLRRSVRSDDSRPRTRPSSRAAGSQSAQPKLRLPADLEIAIGQQRGSVGTAISLLYCLHLALCHEIEGGQIEGSEAVRDASQWADLTQITAMLLVRLHAVHTGLDSVSLVRAKVDPGDVLLADAARELVMGGDGRQAGGA